MTERFNSSGDIFMPVDVAVATQLTFARGLVGQRYPLNSEEEKAAFAQECAEHTLALTLNNTADCGDERVTIALGDGTDDPDTLRNRIAPQLFGGMYLSATKAVTEAGAEIVQDAKSFMGAFLIVKAFLDKLEYHDAAHELCGAEAAVESSVENQIEFNQALGGVGLLVADDGGNGSLLQRNTETKSRLLSDGFYGDWDPAKRKELILADAPGNYSFLKVDANDHETHGHNGSGLYVVTQPGQGYQKTGRAFAVTLPTMHELAYKLGGSNEERRRIVLGFADDTLHVGAGIVTKDFPVFAQAA